MAIGSSGQVRIRIRRRNLLQGTLPVSMGVSGTLATIVQPTTLAGTIGITAGVSGTLFTTVTNPGTGDITTFQLTSTAAGTYPFSWALGFTKTDAPQTIVTNLTNYQVKVLRRWADGSVKHALISGRATFAAPGVVTVTVSRGTYTEGAPLTSSNIATANPQASITCSGLGTVNLSSLTPLAPWKTWVSGPEMVNCIYRAPVPGSSHLVAFFDVRLWADGRVSILPYLENGYFLVANPTNISTTVTLTVNGSTVLTQALTIRHHTRLPLVGTSGEDWWIGTAPPVTMKHNGAYLRASRLVPNVGASTIAPSAGALNGLVQNYTINSTGYAGTGMGAAGTHADLIPRHAALYITSGDPRALRATLVNAMMWGAFSIHYRDHTTNEPIVYSSYPLASVNVQDTPIVPTGTGDIQFKQSHHPNPAYIAYLVTGRLFYLEEMLFTTSYNYLSSDVVRRFNGEGVFTSMNGAYTTRGAGWSLRTLAQALALCPTTHAVYASYSASWNANMDRAKAWFIDGTLYTDQYVSNVDLRNNLGQPGFYVDYDTGTTQVRAGPWQQAYFAMSVGFAWDAEPAGAPSANHQAFRDFLYKQPVALAGDGTTGVLYRSFGIYELPIGTTPTAGEGGVATITYLPDFAAVWTAVKARDSDANSQATATGLSLRYGGADIVAADLYDAFVGQKIPALAYAVDHGAPGAQAAWGRIAGSSSWQSLANAAYADAPEFGVVPRNYGLPAHLTASTLQWGTIAGSSASSLNASLGFTPLGTGPFNSRIDAWGGLGIRLSTAEIFSFGGGHTDGALNDVIRYNLATASGWVRIGSASPNGDVVNNGNWFGSGSSARPSPPHNYQGLQVVEAQNRLFSVGRKFVYGSGPPSFNELTGFNLGTNTWDPQNSLGSLPGGTPDEVCQDPAGNIYYKVANNLYRIAASNRAITTISTALYGDTFGGLAYDSNRDRILYYGGYNGVQLQWISASGGAVNTVTGSLNTSLLAGTNQYPGLIFDATGDRLLVKLASGSNFIAINAATFACTTLTIGGVTPPTPGTGVGNKVVFVPAWNTIFYYPLFSGLIHYVRLR